nr:MAG TPA: DNA-directed RNA polymerase II subunit [Caudoviricetes sp.]
MKAIERCCECAYYSMRKHKCKRGAKDKGEPTARFYADCPLDEAEMVRHGTWDVLDGCKTRRVCSACGWDVPEYGKFYSYCPNCGAKMDGGDDDAANHI